MKLIDFYERVIETTGLDVMTLPSIKAAIKNCMADLTSRGYRIFTEKQLQDLVEQYHPNAKGGYALINDEYVPYETNMGKVERYAKAYSYIDKTMIEVDMPKNVRKILYCKVFFNNNAVSATRYSLSNKRVSCQYINGRFRSHLQTNEAIFFVKGDKLIIEWHPAFGDVTDISFGYYQKLEAPEFDADVSDIKNLVDVEINIREEFEDALVFYAAYFYYSRYVKDTDKIQLYLSNYKYYVEDITHELAYEDEYFEEDAVIKTDDED
jgi:hypothetical protein